MERGEGEGMERGEGEGLERGEREGMERGEGEGVERGGRRKRARVLDTVIAHKVCIRSISHYIAISIQSLDDEGCTEREVGIHRVVEVDQ